MSIVRISGGLGNQLFQAVFASVLADQTGEESILDVGEYRFRNKSSHRPFELDQLLDFKLVGTSSIFTSHLPTRFSLALERDHMRNLNSSRIENLPVVREVPLPTAIYDPQLSRLAGHYYVGYFISHKYWNRDPSYYFNLVYESLKRKCRGTRKIKHSTIGMHVRRGDYLDNSKVRNLHGYCNDHYYLKAVERLLEGRHEIMRVLISTDSVERIEYVVKGIQQLGLNVEILDSTDPTESMVILAECDYFVGSNSTFSWWASNLVPKKKSIFPRDWFVKEADSFSLDAYFPTPVFGIPNALTSEPYID